MGALAGINRRLHDRLRIQRLVLDGDVPTGGTPKQPPLFINPTEPPSASTAAIKGAIYFDDDANCLMQYTGSAWEEVGASVSTADGLTVNGVIVPVTLYMNFQLKPFATVTEYDLAVVKRALQVVSIDCTPSTLQGGALTATVVKASGTSAPANGTTPLHTANAINLNTGAYTNQSITLTATTADLIFAAGDRIGIDYSAAYTTGHAALTIGYKYV